MRSKSAVLALSLVAAAFAPTIAGCNIIGPAYVLLHGPPKQPAQYTLDPERSVVVFVDDRSNVLPRRALRQIIGESAQKSLLASGDVTNVIDSRDALAAASRDKFDQPMTIVDIARSVQAETVIYVSVEQLALSEDGQSVSPVASAWVKVIDATDEKRLWPEDKAGARVGIRPRFEQGFTPQSQADVARAQNAVAERLGVAIAQVFYDHETFESEIQPE